ncbi:alpha/beta hydrolase [Sphingobium boeckii]|uniref:Arylformamidase n=1 Tax=Sphingobium boeckii TaxID=1082345 RepID=A0A7W9EFT4_9SPHN|nr:alpha/beta hydrolase [Sphingobium boeckii]MBB5686345.1 arylformamidase [Sphingobium boeckii]
MGDNEFEYVTGQGRSGFPRLLQSFEAASEIQAKRQDSILDRQYGAHARQRLDFFPAKNGAIATLVYFHAGYWQSRDKSTFRFIAPPFNEALFNVALVNYPLCPDATVAQLTDATAESLTPVADLDKVPLILAGHSAGAHLAIELGMRCAKSGPTIAGIAAISGVFDLQPLTSTSLNQNLQMDKASARSASPAFRVLQDQPQAIFAVGGEETEAFLLQTLQMHRAWRSAGNESHHHIVDGADHFTILSSFTDPNQSLHRLVTQLV